MAATTAILFFFAVGGVWAQTPTPDPGQSGPKQEAPPCQKTKDTAASSSHAESQSATESAGKKPNGTPNEGAPNGTSDDNCAPPPKDGEQDKQTNRILWVVPNFAAVSANTQLPPLSTKGKFWLATEDTFDYSSFVWTGILSGQEFGSKAYPEFGQGMAGYGRYFYHLFIDGVSGSYFTEAIVPSITHEDPRYYTLGRGHGFLRRTGYALSRVVITKTDSGKNSFNWSEIGGNALEAGLANAYYPAQERGGRQTAINWGAQLESAALNNIAKEFWPDIHRFLFGEKEKKEK